MGKAIFPQKAPLCEVRDLQRRGAAACFPVGHQSELSLEYQTDLLIMIPTGKNRFMLIVGFHMAVIMEDRALLFRKNGKYRKLCQYSQQLFLREFPAVLPVQMALRRGDIVPFQHSPDGVPLLPHKMDELLPL